MKSTIAVLLGNEYEDTEFEVPRRRLEDRGYAVERVGIRASEKVRGKKGTSETIIESPAGVHVPDEFAGLLIPGGRSPSELRGYPHVVEFVRRYHASGRPVAAICHGPQLLAQAGVLRGATLTSWPTVRDELERVGATWIDEPCVVDGSLITSRRPEDLDVFCDALLAQLGERDDAEAERERAGITHRRGCREQPYGRQTHGGLSYGRDGVSGQDLTRPIDPPVDEG